MNWIRAVLVVAVCLYFAWNGFAKSDLEDVANKLTPAELKGLASTVKSGDVVMYTTTECGYCAQAKSWLAQYDFAFTECNMSVSSRCESEFKGYGATGTPYLIVRGRHMKDGFDSDEFLALLKN